MQHLVSWQLTDNLCCQERCVCKWFCECCCKNELALPLNIFDLVPVTALFLFKSDSHQSHKLIKMIIGKILWWCSLMHKLKVKHSVLNLGCQKRLIYCVGNCFGFSCAHGFCFNCMMSVLYACRCLTYRHQTCCWKWRRVVWAQFSIATRVPTAACWPLRSLITL